MLSSYFHTDRHYHNILHIADLLKNLHILVNVYRDRIVYLDELIHAVIWHDAYYDPNAPKGVNENYSSIISLEELEAASINKSWLQDLLIATVHDVEVFSIEEQIIADIDLMGLAADPETFAQNSANIRKEYPNITDKQFNEGRKKFFEFLLEKKFIYHTDYCRTLCEGKARKNLTEALQSFKLEL